MEKRNEERLKRAIADFIKQYKEYNVRVETFMKEFWTPEVNNMYETIVDAFKRRNTFYGDKYHNKNINVNGCEFRPFTNSYSIFYVENQPVGYTHSTCAENLIIHYTHNCLENEDINNLSISIHDLHSCMEMFKILQDNAEDIINIITSLYKEVTEKQSDELDKVFEELGIEEPKTRHIKVTVEWV
jgi:hypothetical protein